MNQISLKEAIRIKSGIDLPISGGYGRSIEEAIVIEIKDDFEAVRLEYEVMDFIFSLAGIDEAEMIEQRMIHQDEKYYDELHYLLSDGSEASYFFDFSMAYGKKHGSAIDY